RRAGLWGHGEPGADRPTKVRSGDRCDHRFPRSYRDEGIPFFDPRGADPRARAVPAADDEPAPGRQAELPGGPGTDPVERRRPGHDLGEAPPVEVEGGKPLGGPVAGCKVEEDKP